MTPGEFIAKWRASELKERSAAQEHFIDLCRLLGEPTPAEADPKGERYCFERGARKDTGGDGWADVWKHHHFAWEYKGKHKDLDAAFNQLRQYALALENPPLLIVSDMARFRIRTNWTNTVSQTHEFTLDDLAEAAVRDQLKWAMTEPERLRPGETRQAVTERAATTFAALAQALRARGHDPQKVAHFVNRLVFCMFAEDVGLLPNTMFTRMLEHARQQPKAFAELARDLFGAMSTGGRVGFEPVAWFNGGLFDDGLALPLEKDEIETTLAAAALDWSEIDPSILGTLFERGLDPDKRSQLGAHYTDRDKIMLIVEPVVIRPWLAEWETAKAEITSSLEKETAAKSSATRTRRRREAERLLSDFLTHLRAFTVLDPACGSGNFLYLALHALKDLEHRVQLEAEALGLEREFPAIGPANVRGIEINPYAAELARVSVWIGEIQWMRRNGFNESRDPILKPLDTIECRDAILTPEGEEPEWPEADVVIGNPPFLGNKKMRQVLGDAYAERLREVYEGRVPGAADLVCFWINKAGELVVEGKVSHSGLVATNSIRGGANRLVLDRIVKRAAIFDAYSDESWVLDGAAVRVALVCFTSEDTPLSPRLNGDGVSRINADLTAGTVDLTKVEKLPTNQEACFRCDEKGGAFDISGDLEQFAFYCSEAVASVANIVGTRGGGDRRESRAHRQPQAGHRAGCHRAQARFELGKNLFDGIEVRAVGRQVEHASAHRLDRGPYAGHFMAGQIIQHHRVARAEGRSEELLDIGHEGRAIERAVQDQRGGQPVGPQRGHHGRRLPVPVRDGGDEAGAAGTPPIPAGQLGLDGGLIHEDEASTVEVSGLGAPALAGGQHIRPVLFSGAQDFFLVLVLSDPRPARPWPD